VKEVCEFENSVLVEARVEVLLSLIKEMLDEEIESSIVVKLVLGVADVLDSNPDVVLLLK
jgi:hypothetical protein